MVNTSNTTVEATPGIPTLVLKSIPVLSNVAEVASGLFKKGNVTPVKVTTCVPPTVIINFTFSCPVFLNPVKVNVVLPEVVKVNTLPFAASIELDPETVPKALTLSTC